MGGNVTWGNILNSVYEFYQTLLSQDELNIMKKKLGEYDPFDYIATAEENLASKLNVKHVALMGSLVFWEGLRAARGRRNTYYVRLGS